LPRALTDNDPTVTTLKENTMRTSFARSIVSLLSTLIMFALLWLILITTANSQPIVFAAPDGGVVGTGTPASCTEAALGAKLAGGGTITFNCGGSPISITLTSMKSISTTTTIDGGGKITLSGGQAVRLFLVEVGAALTVKNITLADGHDAFGGCVLDAGAFSAYNTTFRNCKSVTKPMSFPAYGGAIAVLSANLYLSNTHLLNNTAELYGGALYLGGSIGQLEKVDILTNTAWITYPGSGGGIYLESSSLLNIYDSHIDGNRMGYQGHGGAIAVYASTAQLFNVTLNNNYGLNAAQGGGLYVKDGTAVLDHVTSTGNYGTGSGGAIEETGSAVTVTNSSLSYNTSSSGGGGIDAYKGSLYLNNVSVKHNSVRSDGGGINLYQTPTALVNVIVSNNHGERNGGGIHNYWETLTLNGVTVSGNEALGNQGDGGGIYNDRGVLNAANSTIDHNVTSGHGGGLYNDSTSTANLTNVTISNNQASVEGGGIYEEPTIINSDASTISLINVTLKDNRASNTGGGFFNANGTSSTNLTVALKNTVLADNVPQNCKGKAFTSAKYSLSTDATCTLSGTGNQSSTPADLFPLGNYGGPTKTNLPGPASPLVNGGGGSSGVDFSLTDQRGVARPQLGGIDIGAVERQSGDVLIAPWVYLPLIVR
jgi:hypothetical protein